MSKNEISQGDCPDSPAAPYPGKYGHNNKTGSKLSRNEFKKAQVRLWVSHFSGNPKYENTHLAHKVIYLSQYLKPLRVKGKEARALLVSIENEGLQPGDAGDGMGWDGDGQHEGDEEEGEEEEHDEGFHDIDHHDHYDVEDMDAEASASGSDSEEEDEGATKRCTREFEIGRYLDMSDQELFLSDTHVPEMVCRSKRYKIREKNFINSFIEERNFENSQEILESLSQAPPVVQETLNEKLTHLSMGVKATRLVMKSLSDTIKRLKETPGREARQQLLVIIAAASHHK